MTALWWILAITTGATLYVFVGSLHWSLGMKLGWFESDPDAVDLVNDPLRWASVLWPLGLLARVVIFMAAVSNFAMEAMLSMTGSIAEWIVNLPERRRERKKIPTARVVER